MYLYTSRITAIMLNSGMRAHRDRTEELHSVYAGVELFVAFTDAVIAFGRSPAATYKARTRPMIDPITLFSMVCLFT